VVGWLPETLENEMKASENLIFGDFSCFLSLFSRYSSFFEKKLVLVFCEFLEMI
jgi:hypothetical protein